MKSLNVDEMIEAFEYSVELKMQEIKDYVLEKKNGEFRPYADLESFNQTIQAIVQSYCEEGYGYKGIPIFKKIRRAYYQLQDRKTIAETWKISGSTKFQKST